MAAINQCTVESLPSVSVIIPVYNAEKYLRQCLDSIVTQTLKDIEIICVDDESTDASPLILQEYANKDPRVSVIRQKNAGAGAARNTGMHQAKGAYLSFLDADDFFEPVLLEELYLRAIQARADIVICRAKYYDNKSGDTQSSTWGIKQSSMPNQDSFSKDDFSDYLLYAFGSHAWNKLFRRNFVEQEQISFQSIKTANDVFFVNSLLALANRISVIDKELIYWRANQTGSLTSSRDKSVGEFLFAWKKLREFLIEKQLHSLLHRSFVNALLRSIIFECNSCSLPNQKKLHDTLRMRWLKELGLLGHPENFFYNKSAYKYLNKIIENTFFSKDFINLYKYKFLSKITSGKKQLRYKSKYEEKQRMHTYLSEM